MALENKVQVDNNLLALSQILRNLGPRERSEFVTGFWGTMSNSAQSLYETPYEEGYGVNIGGNVITESLPLYVSTRGNLRVGKPQGVRDSLMTTLIIHGNFLIVEVSIEVDGQLRKLMDVERFSTRGQDWISKLADKLHEAATS